MTDAYEEFTVRRSQTALEMTGATGFDGFKEGFTCTFNNLYEAQKGGFNSG